MYIPDNYDLFARHDAEQEAKLQTLPECSECGEKIQDEHCFEINGEYICKRCMEGHKKHIEDLIF